MHAAYPVVLDRYDPHDETLDFHRVVFLRDRSHFVEDQPSERFEIVCFGVERGAEQFVHVIKIDARIEQVRSVVETLVELLFAFVVLVADFPTISSSMSSSVTSPAVPPYSSTTRPYGFFSLADP